MSKVRGKSTASELAVRAARRESSIIYRLHAKELTGKPDIVNKKRRRALAVENLAEPHPPPNHLQQLVEISQGATQYLACRFSGTMP
jgi:DNA mismatch endonuclease (patch repair protein)